MLALILALLISVPLGPDDAGIHSVWVHAPEHWYQPMYIDTGSSISTISGNYLWKLLDDYQDVGYELLPVELADGSFTISAVFLVPHFRVDGCDLGSVLVEAGPEGGPNLIGMNVLKRFKHWHFHNRKFEFECG